MLNSKFSRSLKGNEVKIDHSIYNHLEKEIHPKNIFAMDFFQCPTFENSFNNVNFFKFHAWKIQNKVPYSSIIYKTVNALSYLGNFKNKNK